MDFVSLRVEFDLGRGVVVNHVRLADGAAVLDRNSGFLQPELSRYFTIESRGRNKSEARTLSSFAKGAEHRSIEYWLRSGYRGISVAHRAPGDEAALDNYFRLDAKERRLP